MLLFMLTGMHSVYATDGKADITGSNFAVDVDIVWGAMSFTYTPEYTKWNPDSHAYDDTVTAAWLAKGNQITVTNVGEGGIRADLSVAVTNQLAEGDTVDAAFKTSLQDEEGSSACSLELEGASGNTTPSGTVYLELSGAISKTYTELAAITITIVAE